MGRGGRNTGGDTRRLAEDYPQTIERMFAAVSDLYARYWDEFFHFAIFERDDESWEAALARTHEQYLRDLRVAEARSVIDLACGRGGFTDLIAQRTAGAVLGIDLSRAQLSHARRFVRPNLRFRHHDVMRVDELGETFDAVALLDAACYLPDKAVAIRKIARVMNPGARLLLVDWCRRDRLSAVQQELVLHPFMRRWGISNLATPGEYERHLRRAGLRLIAMRDLNERVRPNWERGYDRAIAGVQEASAADAARLVWKALRLGADGIRLIKDQFAAALYIKAGFDSGFLRYVSYLVDRPS